MRDQLGASESRSIRKIKVLETTGERGGAFTFDCPECGGEQLAPPDAVGGEEFRHTCTDCSFDGLVRIE